MTLHLHHLTGCAPTPLAHYLKALGILRVVGEQADCAARGWWQDEHFCLLTGLDRAELEQFFLEQYAPTPVFNPWGARSGFYREPSERTARVALEKIEMTTSDRLAPYRETISTVRRAVAEGGGTKPENEDAKFSMLARLRREARGAAEEWLGAVVALVGDDYRTPALMGTGGNEGSGSYTSAYLNAVVECLIDRNADHALGLFSTSGQTPEGPVRDYSWGGSFGQFMPDGGGSAWDLLLALEGASLFGSAVALRFRSGRESPSRFLSSPFYFAPHAVGAGSISEIDEFSLNKGRRNPGRGEQWFPLWEVPAGLCEIRAVVSDGRCSVAGGHARGVLDAARALGSAGVARGITAFCRYGYLQRNNQATHFAVPLGRVQVRDRTQVRLVDDIAQWLDALHRHARNKHAASSLVHVEHRLGDAVFAALTHDDAPDRWQAVLLAAAEVEAVQVSGTGFEAGPIPALTPDWIRAADDGSPEWRLACALGSAAAAYDRHGLPHDPVRGHWVSLERGGRRFLQKKGRLVRDARVVAGGRDAVADLAALVERRLLEALASGRRQLPLVAARGCEANPADLAHLVAGHVDLARVSMLARALMAVRWNRWQPGDAIGSAGGAWPDEPWVALRLACLAWPVDQGRAIPADTAIVRRLMTGDGTTAVAIALRRLRAAGLRPPLQGACSDLATARLWAAALAFPISHAAARTMARQFEPKQPKEAR